MAADPNIPILIVDDYREMARLVGTLLRKLGFYNVEEVTNANAALDRLRDKEFGLVISDVNMQPMDGLQLLREVRADNQLKRLPFILISGHGDADTVSAAKAAGVTGFIVKPFTTATLNAQMVAALDGV